MKRNKEGEIRARCEVALEKDVELIAASLGLDKSDVIRMACVQFVRKQLQAQQTQLQIAA